MIVALTGHTRDPSGNVGSAGAGKSTVANRLVSEHGFVDVGVSDPMKRICSEVFGWDPNVLWGSSELKETGDPRWTRGDGTMLTPREALVSLGTEWGRRCHHGVWLACLLRTLDRLNDLELTYRREVGVVPCPVFGRRRSNDVVVSDLRLRSEVEVLRDLGAFVVRVHRPVDVVESSHVTEVDLVGMEDREFDWVLMGRNHDVPDLESQADHMVRELRVRP